MNKNVLDTALSFAKKKKYDDAIRLLEGEIPRFRTSFTFYYILALSCLRTGNYGNAYIYFTSAYNIKKNEGATDVNTILGIAAINLKRGESARAIDFYLKVLDEDPANRKAAKALGILRRMSNGDSLAGWLDSGKIEELYPPFPRSKLKAGNIILPLIIIIAAAALAALFRAGKISLKDIFEREERAGFKEASLSAGDREKTVETGGSFRDILGESEILRTYEKARGYFNSFDDNRAIVELNKIELSNASPGIKKKARLLLSYINKMEPALNSTNIRTQFSYNQVAKDPPVYRGCYVIWKGMAANIREEADSSSFDLLAGYESKTKLLGTVPVHCQFASEISPERPVEIFGRVVPDSAAVGAFRLEAVTIHQSIRE